MQFQPGGARQSPTTVVLSDTTTEMQIHQGVLQIQPAPTTAVLTNAPADEDKELCARRGNGTPRERAIFHPPPSLLARDEMIVNMPIIVDRRHNRLEPLGTLPAYENALIPTTLGGQAQYRVLARVGQGATATTWRCVRTDTAHEVCLKLVSCGGGFLDVGLSEARLLQRLAEEMAAATEATAIVRIEEFYYHREHLFIVQELLGPSVQAHYRALGASRLTFYTQDKLQQFVRQIVGALAFLHARGMIHCDVKPDNICLTAAGGFKLVDFGATLLSHDELCNYVQARWYRAPEVMLGIQYDTKIDVFSLACSIAETILGHSPFRGRCPSGCSRPTRTSPRCSSPPPASSTPSTRPWAAPTSSSRGRTRRCAP